MRINRGDHASRMATPLKGVASMVLEISADEGDRHIADEIRAGLDDPRQPWISPTYLYDEAGSQIYEAITRLPEYYPARTEAMILTEAAPWLAAHFPVRTMFELGSGSSTKTQPLIEAVLRRGAPLTYMPIDVDGQMLQASARHVLAKFPGLKVIGLAGRFELALRVLPPQPEMLAVFLGGTIGNFTPEAMEAFVAQLAGALPPGGHLLLGFDRRAHARKPAAVIRAAYDDAAGVTARFNRNALAHLNRVIGSDFVPARWQHVARYDEAAHQIEMYLESLCEQVVAIPRLDRRYAFAKGQRILTEISRKFDPDELVAWFRARGYAPIKRWSDPRDYFGLLLLERLG